jgi:hypothetical protein
MYCSAAINVMSNTLKCLSIISERTAKINDEYGKMTDVGQLFYFKLFGQNCMKIFITGQIFLSNYK